MRYLPFFLFALLVGAYALADGYSSYKDAPPGGSVDGKAISPSSVTTGTLGLTTGLSADMPLGGYDLYNQAVKTTDAAPDASSMSCGQSAYWAAAAGANSTGGACYLSGGVGARKVAVVAAAIENDTLVIAGIKGGVATSCTWTYNVAGIGTCAALTNSQCAVLLKNYCNTNGPACGVASCECADATCTVATVGFVPSNDTTRLALTASDGSQTVTSGNDGGTVVGWMQDPSSTTNPGYGGLYFGTSSGANFRPNQYGVRVHIGASGDAALYANSFYTTIGTGGGSYPAMVYGTGITAAAGDTLAWATRAKFTSPADAQWRLTGATASNGSFNIDITGFTKGETATLGTSTQTVTFAANPGDATKVTANLIPDGAFLKGIVTRVVTPGTNCTSCNYGDGTDPDIYGATIQCDEDATTTTNANFTANIANPQLAAGEVTVTAVGGNCYDAVIRITAIYETFTAPTAD